MQRPPLLRTYKEELSTYISLKYGVSKERALEIATEICVSNYKPLTAIIEDTSTDNKPIIRAVDLASWFDRQRNNILTPSGGVYCSHEKKTGTIIAMIAEFMAKRKAEKKAMLKCKAAGDKTGQLSHYYAQTLIKIFINALPGNFGSKYSIFYDKGNYNAITSCGRALIAFAYSEIEAVLGGNFMWLTIDDLRSHIISQLYVGIDEAKVKATMDKYGLAWKSKEDLFQFYKKELMIYNHYTDYMHKNDDRIKHAKCRDKMLYNFLDKIRKSTDTVSYARYNGHTEGDMAKIAELIWKLTDEQVQYFYYFENLRHIIMGNDSIFRNFFHDLFNFDLIPQDDTVSPDDLFKVDGALVIMINVAFHKYLDPHNSEIQVYDLPKERPDLAKIFVNIARYVEKKLSYMNDLFDTFIYTPICRPNDENQQLLYRNTTVVSDTDSVIFTVKDWVEWYTGSVYSINEEAYHIAMVMIYWISKAVDHSMFLFSEAQGAKKEYLKKVAMKNEFLYPVMIQADVKKHYAGVITVQEGVILPEPDIDIKGGQLRGSKVPKVALKFAEDLISNDILDVLYRKGRVNAHALVDKVRAFEQHIFDDIQSGSTEWYESLSIKTPDKYAKPMSSAWYYYHAWEEIFAFKYGDIMIPTKTPAVPLIMPTETYWEWLRNKDEKVWRTWNAFLNRRNKDGSLYRWPSKMAVNPLGGKVPEELIPLIDVKEIISATVSPCHLILRQLAINCGHEDASNLFSTIYPVVRGKKENNELLNN